MPRVGEGYAPQTPQRTPQSKPAIGTLVLFSPRPCQFAYYPCGVGCGASRAHDNGSGGRKDNRAADRAQVVYSNGMAMDNLTSEGRDRTLEQSSAERCV